MEKDEIIVAVPLDVLEDLASMARKSDQYRAGYAWTAVAMHITNRIINGALYRISKTPQ